MLFRRGLNSPLTCTVLERQMTCSKIVPLNQAAEFDVSELFFSTTDRKGKILTCNEVFTRIAGYSSEQILGAPHNIIRHPDMPKCVFHLLWENLLVGRPLGAYVKNMASSGAYYWVYTLVLPLGDGFLSIRLKPTTETLETVEAVYAKLLETEQSYGEDWRKGMAASGDELMETLSSIGFESYEPFMHHCLRAELSARNQAIEARSTEEVPVKPNGMKRVFHELGALDQLNQEAEEQAHSLAAVSEAMKRIGLNASICAAKIGELGLPLGVLSAQATTIAKDVSIEAQRLGTEQVALSCTLDATAFQMASAALVSEMIACFQAQAESCMLDAEQQVASYGCTYKDLSTILFTAFTEAVSLCKGGTVDLQDALQSFTGITERFSKILLTTRMNQTTGRSIAASIAGGDEYSRVLEEMARVADDARKALESLQRTVDHVKLTLEGWQRERVLG